MISSMTGYGRGEVCSHGITAVTEIRSVNSRFLEIATRLPHSLTLRENDVKEIVRKRITRGKINLAITITHENQEDIPLRINRPAAKAYYHLLTELRKAVKIRSQVSLEHLLQFPDILEPQESDPSGGREWSIAEEALMKAVEDLQTMRLREGEELKSDLMARVHVMARLVDEIEHASKKHVPEEHARLRERVQQLLADQSSVDEGRLELELALLADKLDVTEECVRFRSHNKFFLDAMSNDDSVGRKLNFLLQEMNREANTIGSKSFDAEIAHKVIAIKEELEKIREQLQNIE